MTIDRSSPEEAVFYHKALLIWVNRTISERSVYEAVRYAWKINVYRAATVEIILAIDRGLVVGAFVASTWLDATAANFPGRKDALGRFGFVGTEAPPDICHLYIGKRLPDKYRPRGASNPIRYT